MPFPKSAFCQHIITNKRNDFLYRKEKEFGHVRNGSSCIVEKASVSASRKPANVTASVTVEAVFCVPLFFFAAVCLIWLLEIRVIQTSVKCGMQEAGKNMAAQMYEIPLLVPAKLEADIVNAIGNERLNRSLILGGSSGLHCEKSYIIPGSGILELKVYYQIKLPFPVFAILPLTYEESLRIKGWNGYVKQSFSGLEDKTVVYVTETGIVYHRDYHCNYLEPSIHMTMADALESYRNEDGSKYHPCEICAGFGRSEREVYITDYGNRYHSTLTCSGLKRKIYAIPIQDAKGKGACSKCGR